MSAPLTCIRCPAPLPQRKPGKAGPPRRVCDTCSKKRKNAKDRAKRCERRLAPGEVLRLPPPAKARPVDAAEEKRRERFRGAVAEGLSRVELLERFPDAEYLLYKLRLRIVPHGGYPAGLPA